MRFVIYLASMLTLAGLICLGEQRSQEARAQVVSCTGSVGVRNVLTSTNCITAAPYQGPGDCTGCATTYTVWYGLSAFSAATAGTKSANVCNTTPTCADINTLANGSFDVATAQAGTTNCGGSGGQCTIAKLYDKSGNGTDCTVTNVINLKFNALGTVPALDFNSGSPGFCQPASLATITSTETMSLVGLFTSGDSFAAMMLAGSPPALVINNGATAIQMTGIQVSASAGTFYVVSGVFNGASSALYLNSASTTGTSSTNTGSQILRVGDGSFKGQEFEAGLQGVVANSTQAAAYSANRRAFYGN